MKFEEIEIIYNFVINLSLSLSSSLFIWSLIRLWYFNIMTDNIFEVIKRVERYTLALKSKERIVWILKLLLCENEKSDLSCLADLVFVCIEL